MNIVCTIQTTVSYRLISHQLCRHVTLSVNKDCSIPTASVAQRIRPRRLGLCQQRCAGSNPMKVGISYRIFSFYASKIKHNQYSQYTNMAKPRLKYQYFPIFRVIITHFQMKDCCNLNFVFASYITFAMRNIHLLGTFVKFSHGRPYHR